MTLPLGFFYYLCAIYTSLFEDMEKLKGFFRQYGFDIIVIALFAAVSFAYFMPADLEGRILYRHDSSAGRGAGQEQQEFLEKTGERTRWTNSTFSGMPTYQTAPSYDSTDVLSKVMNAYHLWLPENVWYVFAYLLGFYILLRAFDFRKELAALGSIIWAFSSYFFIIIAAGHIWKVMALAYLPPMIAGVVYAYRGKYMLGFLLTAVFSAFEVKANHVQMTYYYLFVIIFMVAAYLEEAIRRKTMVQFCKATAVCVVGAAIGICINLSNLYHTWQYGKESMRGASELVKKDAANQTSSGLDRDYITAWSYGVDETWTLLVPNAKGGASVPMAMNEKAMSKANPEYYNFYQQLGQYWGDQPGTSGPVYVGAFVVMLFILSLFVVKGPMKWALLGATVLSILLSWGRNFMPFTDFFIDHVPMYSKFRTVASILVIAEFTIPLLAMMALKTVMDTPDFLKKHKKSVIASFVLSAGVCVLFAAFPGLVNADFFSQNELEQFNRIAQQGPEAAAYMAGFKSDLANVRSSIFVADCWRSFFVIVVGCLALMLYSLRKLSGRWTVAVIAALCLIDMWQVNKRYLNDGMFVEKSQREQPQEMTETDKIILQDTTLDYRVLNLASNTFNENETSYYHKSIGGYHAAKLHRYQDMIEYHISPEMQKLTGAVMEAGGDMTKVNGDSIYPVLNALNTRYFILPLQNGQTVPLRNPYAYGNAWFVDKIEYADNANGEMDAIAKLDLRHEAVADKKFQKVLGEAVGQDTLSIVTMKDYKPNELTYEVNSGKGGIVVFSEIYYPGWTAKVDGKGATLGRVDYILRALNLPAGKHEVVLTFKPRSIKTTETVAYISYALLLLAIAGGVYCEVRRRKR